MYWGKIIGTLAGALTLKPWFMLLGLILGHQFDRGFEGRYRKFEYEGKANRRLPEEFVTPLFQTMGHLAKADGRVSAAEIRAARTVMHRLNLGPAQVRKAINSFEDGKRRDYPLQATMRHVRRIAARNPELRQLFVRLLLDVALSKNRLGQKERSLLWTVCKEFEIGRVELAQMEAMIRAQKSFRRSPAGDADADRLRRAYSTLGVDRAASNADIKQAYRRLMSRNHPDKIAGDNPDREVVAEAEQRTREVRRAYEMLKARRSIR